MDNSKTKLTWRQTALFTAALGASFLLNGQVGHADQTAAGQQQTVSAQNNVAIQESVSAETARGTNSANTLSGKEQSPSAEPAIKIISGNLNEPKADAIKQQMHEVAVENNKEVNALSAGLDKSEAVDQQATDEYGKLYADALNNPQNYIDNDTPAELRERVQSIYKQKQETQKLINAQPQIIAENEQLVAKKQQIVDQKQQAYDQEKQLVDAKEASGVSGSDLLGYKLELESYANDLMGAANDLTRAQLKLNDAKSKLGDYKSTLFDLHCDMEDVVKKNEGYFIKVIKSRPAVANLRKEAQRLCDEAFKHSDRAKALKAKYVELQKILAGYSAEIYKVCKTVTRTIQINFPGRGNNDVTQTAKVFGEEVRSNGQVNYRNWQSASWPEYTPATYFGYTCDVDRVPSVTVDHNTPNQTVTITYTAQPGLNSSYNHDDQGNYACLDHYQLNGTQLQVSGWHATSDVKNKPYHYLIVFDNTTNSEVIRRMVGQTARPDVAVAHNVYGAGLAGFQANLDLPTAILRSGDRLSLVSRYTDDQAGNGNGTDYWFGGLQIDQGNHGYLDIAQVQNGKLHVAGWHATNQAVGRDHHVLILFDASQGREIARLNATATARPDIAKIYPMISNAATAGFTADFALTPAMATDNLQVISRYSSDADANSDYVDFWSTPRRLTTDLSNQGWLDDVSVHDGQLHIAGWYATNLALGRQYHTIIILNANTGKEITRQTTDQLVQRHDLVQAFPNVLTAQQSGINVTMQLKPGMADQPIQIISRYSTTADANSDYVDYWFNPQRLVKDPGNYANLDGFGVRDGKIYASGWHASDRSLGRPYHYIIIFDATPGVNHELTRFNVTKHETSRLDVARAYPQLLTAQNSGFDISFANDPNFTNGHQLQIVSRWTDDPAGNGNAVDYWFKPLLIEV